MASGTSYPRFLEVLLIDFKRSQIPEKIEVIWQGEVRSSGSTSDISILAPAFLDVLFENYGQTVNGKTFFRTR